MTRDQIPALKKRIADAEAIIAEIDKLAAAKTALNGTDVQEITIDIDEVDPAVYVSGDNGANKTKIIQATPAMLQTIKVAINQVIEQGIRNSEDALNRV